MDVLSRRRTEKQVEIRMATLRKAGGQIQRPEEGIHTSEQAAVNEHRLEPDIRAQLPNVAGLD